MKKLLFPLFTLIATALSSLADDPERACVWVVKSKSGDSSIYFAGSMPILRQSDLPLPGQYRAAFDAAERVVFPSDPSKAKGEEAAQKSIRRGLYQNGGKISEDISEETYEKLGDFLAGSGSPRNGMDRLRPWFAAVMITMTELMKLGMTPENGVNGLIESWALKEKKEIGGLEGHEVELGILVGLPKGAQEYMLKQSLKDVGDTEKLEKELEEYVAAWRRGDVKRMEEIDEEDEEPSEEDEKWDKLMEEQFWKKRGSKWIKKIEKSLEGGGGTLYVIGAGQLAGKDGILERLEKKGYDVQQMKKSDAGGKPEKKKEEKKKDRKKKPALIPVST